MAELITLFLLPQSQSMHKGAEIGGEYTPRTYTLGVCEVVRGEMF